MPSLPGGFDAFKLEIGIGNGDALIHMAAVTATACTLASKCMNPVSGVVSTTSSKLQLSNLRLISHDAIEVLEQMIGRHALDRILLFFPDPWHKKRHHKRRIVESAFSRSDHLR